MKHGLRDLSGSFFLTNILGPFLLLGGLFLPSILVVVAFVLLAFSHTFTLVTPFFFRLGRVIN